MSLFWTPLRRREHKETVDLEWIKALYEALMDRQATPSEAEVWIPVLVKRGRKAVIREFMASDEYKDRVKIARGLTDNWSRSQYGEIEILLGLMAKRLHDEPVVVEVGAAGVQISNSLDLVGTMGWRGLLIEASPPHAEKLSKEVHGLDVDVVATAVSAHEGNATFYVAHHPHLSSLDRSSVEAWGPVLGEVEVPTRRLHSILEEYLVPSNFLLLSIDIEGLDFEVLNDLIENSEFRPEWVLIEWGHTIFEATLHDERVAAVVRDEYEIITNTFSNVVLQRRAPKPEVMSGQ